MSAPRPRTPRGPARFKERDITRAFRGARKANIAVAAVDILPDGSIRIIPGTPPPVAVTEPNPWDD